MTRRSPVLRTTLTAISVVFLTLLGLAASPHPAAAFRMETGSYVGQGQSVRPITGVGFQPDVVIVKAEAYELGLIKTATMPGTGAKPMGFDEFTLPDLIYSLDADGFTVGDDAKVNTTGVTYQWIAFEALPGELQLGSYFGDDTDNRSINGIGFQPGYVLILADSERGPVHRFPSMAGDACTDFGYGIARSDGIQAFEADGFQVGSLPEVNQSGTTYHYVAFKMTPGSSAGGSYTGDGSDDRDVLGLGFQPDYVILKTTTTQHHGLQRSPSMVGDKTLYFNDDVDWLSNQIQTLQPDGFQVGSFDEVNEIGQTFAWVAFKNTAVDLVVSKIVNNPTPAEGDTVTYAVQIANGGPDSATSLAVSDVLPSGITFESSLATHGSYDSGSGDWTIGTLGVEVATLTIVASVDNNTGGSIITNTATITAFDQPDIDTGDNSSSVDIYPVDKDTQVATGWYWGIGGPGNIITGIGFAPDAVLVKRDGTGNLVLRTSDMPFGFSTRLGGNGGINLGDIVSLDADGFTVAGSSTVNALDDDYYWAAFQAAPGELVVGSYTGDDADDRSIGGVGFEPNYLIIASEDTEVAMQRFAQQPFDRSRPFDADSDRPDRIQDFEPDGFQVGKHNTTNKNGVVYHYVAFNGQAGRMADGAYLGDGVDNRNLPIGFHPEVAFVASKQNNGPTIFRPRSLAGNSSFYVDGSGAATNLIQNFNGSGIQIGDDSAVNKIGDDYYFMAVGTTPTIDLEVSLLVDNATPNEGESVTYDLSITSLVGTLATGIRVSAKLPPGLTYLFDVPTQGSYDPGTGLWTVGDLGASASAVLSVTASVDPGTAGQMISTTGLIVGVDQTDADSSNDSASAEITVGSTDVRVTKLVSDPSPNEGDPLVYTVNVSNDGPDAAGGLVISDLLPNGVTHQSHSPSLGTYDPGTGLWLIGALGNGGSASLTINATVDVGTAGTKITNIASVANMDQADPVPGNDAGSVDITVTSSDLSLGAGVDNNRPDEGATITFTVTLANNGPDSANNVFVSDVLPSGVTHVSHTASLGTYDEVSGDWDLGTLANGAAASLDIDVTIDAGTAGTVITNTALVSASSQGDPIPGNNSASVDVTVWAADLSIGKTVDNPTPNEGDPLRYTIVITNSGPDHGGSVTVTDSLPSEVTFVGYSSTGGGYDPVTGVWNTGSLAVGDSDTLVIDVTVNLGTGGSTIINTASVSTTNHADPNPLNNSSSAAVGAIAADLAVGNSVDDGTPNEGDTITFTLRVTNNGPDDATGVAVADTLPTGLSFVSATPSQGSYDQGTGIWTVGDISGSTFVTLTISANVDAGTGGQTMGNVASISASDQADPVGGNNLAFAPVTVQSADLAVDKSVDAVTPDERGSITYTIDVTNRGPSTATNVVATDALPPGATFVSSSATQGTYDDVSGIWTIGTIPFNGTVTLTIDATLDAGTGGTVIVNTATITGADQADPIPGNNSDNVQISVRAVDVALTKTVDTPNPNESQTVTYTVTVTNNGPSTASGIQVTDALPAGVTFVSATPQQGSFDGGTSVWDVGVLANGTQVSLQLRANVDVGTGGQTITNTARVTAVAQTDTDNTNDIASADILVVQFSPVVVSASNPSTGAVLPGDDKISVFEIQLANQGGAAETLTELRLTNATFGLGSQSQLDSNWDLLELYAELDKDPIATVACSGGLVVFPSLSITLPGMETTTLTIKGTASLQARDGDSLDLMIASPNDLLFSRVINLSTSSLDPAGEYLIDGMSADQLTLQTVPAGTFLTGSTRNLALDVVLPPNGYEADTLTRLNVMNYGKAQDVIHVLGMEAWIDNGDGNFNPGIDGLIGEFLFTGDVWELTAINHAIPLTGQRLFVTIDIPDGVGVGQPPLDGETIQLGLPSGPDVAIRMASGNDGPLDQIVVNAQAQTLGTANKVTLSALPLPPGTVNPGQRDVVLMRLVATNTYQQPQTLRRIEFTNMTSGPGTPTQAELDAEIQVLRLRSDDDDDGGVGSLVQDGTVGSDNFFENGVATFDGLNWTLSAGETRTLILTARVSPNRAADIDRLETKVDAPQAVDFEGASLAAIWPLDGGTSWTIDGMLAAQIELTDVPVATLGPTESALALDILIPANGYRSDFLNGVIVENSGTAVATDVDLHLYVDDGNSAFDPLVDTDLGPMIWTDPDWTSPLLTLPISGQGQRLFISATATLNPTNSATVQLEIPNDGVSVDSGNDGPIDRSAASAQSLTITSSPLASAIELDPVSSTPGTNVTARMIVRNLGSENIQSVQPSALTEVLPDASPASRLFYQVGPQPPQLDLAIGAIDTFTWVYQSLPNPGGVLVSGNASGTGETSGLQRLSLDTQSNTHQIFEQALSLELVPVGSMPFSVNRGQANVVPLSLTFTNPGGVDASDILVRGLRMRVEDGQDNGIIPASLLASITVNEGTTEYLNKTSLETSGDEVDLTLSTPVLVGDEPVSVSLQLAILPTTVETSFLISIGSESWFVAEDGTNSAPVSIVYNGSFPVESGLASIFAEATELQIASANNDTLRVTRGQVDVPLLSLDLNNPGVDGLTGDVKLWSFAISLIDDQGAVIPDPSPLLTGLRVRGAVQTYLDRGLLASDDSTLVLNLSPQVDAPVNTPTPITVYADLAIDAPLVAFHARLLDDASLIALDANTGTQLPVTLASDPLEGGLRIVEAPLASVWVQSVPRLPSQVALGEVDVPAMDVVVSHPGPPGTARAAVDRIILHTRDESRASLTAASYLDRVEVLWDGASVAELTSIPSGLSQVIVPLAGLMVDPQNSGTLTVVVDFDLSAPESFIELASWQADVQILDVNSGNAALVEPAPGALLPLVSGLTQLRAPAQELVVGLESRLPAVAVAGAADTPAADISVLNTASTGAGDISLGSLTFVAQTPDGSTIAMGSVLSGLHLTVDDSTVVSVTGITPDSTTTTLTFTPPLEIPPGLPVVLDLTCDLQAQPGAAGFRLGLHETGVGVIQPQSALLAIDVEPEPGSTFPLWTEVASFTQANLEDSFSNYPNPFAAGREVTNITFYLASAGQVTLDIYTLTGDRVIRLLDGERRTAGLQNDIEWDGRNGSGRVVRNGAYLLRLKTEGGQGQELIRKIAVVR